VPEGHAKLLDLGIDLSLFANDSPGCCAGCLLNFYTNSFGKHNSIPFKVSGFAGIESADQEPLKQFIATGGTPHIQVLVSAGCWVGCVDQCYLTAMPSDSRFGSMNPCHAPLSGREFARLA
jgi:hypothetical protein